MRNMVGGLTIALGVALAASPVRIAGIDAWKIVLALTGLAFVVLAGRGERTPPS